MSNNYAVLWLTICNHHTRNLKVWFNTGQRTFQECNSVSLSHLPPCSCGHGEKWRDHEGTARKYRESGSIKECNKEQKMESQRNYALEDKYINCFEVKN